MALLLLGRSLSVGGANLGPAPRDGAGGGDVVGGDQTPWEGSELAGVEPSGWGRCWVAPGLGPHLPETALSSLPFSPASRPPSLFLHLLLPHLAPSGVLSCSPCFVSPPWESKGPWGQSQAPQSPRGGYVPSYLPGLPRMLPF